MFFLLFGHLIFSKDFDCAESLKAELAQLHNCRCDTRCTSALLLAMGLCLFQSAHNLKRNYRGQVWRADKRSSVVPARLAFARMT